MAKVHKTSQQLATIKTNFIIRVSNTFPYILLKTSFKGNLTQDLKARLCANRSLKRRSLFFAMNDNYMHFILQNKISKTSLSCYFREYCHVHENATIYFTACAIEC